MCIRDSINPEVGMYRNSGKRDRFEQNFDSEEKKSFHKRVREGYLQLAKKDFHRWLIIDGELDTKDVTAKILHAIETIIGNLPKQESFIINSIFNSGLAEFDQNVAFININSLESLFDINKKDRNLEIYLKDPVNIETNKLIVQKIFNDEFVYSWSDMNTSLFSALKVERNVMFIILSLIIV